MTEFKKGKKRCQVWVEVETADFLAVVAKNKGVTLASYLRGMMRQEAATLQRVLREGVPS